jgi:(p)ppGpp synthase/HD superfamily hydrolase
MLHDVLEDTGTTYSEIRSNFGIDCADLVAELTRRPDEDYFDHCSKMSKVAALIKVCDILANLTDLSSDKSPRFVDKRLQALGLLREKTKELV